MQIKIKINYRYHQPLPEYDPLNLPRTVPAKSWGNGNNHIHPDTKDIIDRLIQAKTEGQVRAIIFDWFRKYSGAGVAGDDRSQDKNSVPDFWVYDGRLLATMYLAPSLISAISGIYSWSKNCGGPHT